MAVLRPEAGVELPDGLGSLSIEPTTGSGLRLEAGSGPLSVRFRHGGERFRPAGRKRSQPLKRIFQAAGIVPWMRTRIRLIESCGRLLAVGDLWVEADALAQPGRPAWRVCWRDAPPYR